MEGLSWILPEAQNSDIIYGSANEISPNFF